MDRNNAGRSFSVAVLRPKSREERSLGRSRKLLLLQKEMNHSLGNVGLKKRTVTNENLNWIIDFEFIYEFLVYVRSPFSSGPPNGASLQLVPF